MAIHALNRKWAEQVLETLGILFMGACLLVFLTIVTRDLPSGYASNPAALSASAMAMSGGAAPHPVRAQRLSHQATYAASRASTR
ncbi:hypothetical protein [Methylobacterium nigriterrae]|uniref:hypothetical protein n=1 Tax=Methylobacterium nigriterrae TaxID=3127512 RepID=UPI003013A19D